MGSSLASEKQVSAWGTVDGFDLPNKLRGFAVARDENGQFLDNVAINVFVDDRLVAVTKPTSSRPDICRGGDHLAGWVVILEENVLLNALALGRLRVYAVQPRLEQDHLLGIWDLVAMRAREQLCCLLAAGSAPSSAASIVRTLAKSATLNAQTQALLARCSTIIPRLANSQSMQDRSNDAERTEISVPIGLQSADGSCVLGRNGTIFLTEGTNAILSRYTTPEAQLSHLSTSWLNLFERRASYCQAAGIRYLQLIIPEKLSVLPDRFPDPLAVPTPLLAAIECQCSANAAMVDCYISVIAALQSSVPEAYFRTDSHLSPFGAWGVVTAVLQRLGLSVDEVNFDEQRQYSGDLAAQIFGTPLVEVVCWPSGPFTVNEPDQLENTAPESGNTGRRIVWKSKTAPFKHRVVAFANSYFERGAAPFNISWWFARLFEEFHFVWSGNCDLGYIRLVAPDLVVCQTVERFLFVNPPAW